MVWVVVTKSIFLQPVAHTDQNFVGISTSFRGRHVIHTSFIFFNNVVFYVPSILLCLYIKANKPCIDLLREIGILTIRLYGIHRKQCMKGHKCHHNRFHDVFLFDKWTAWALLFLSKNKVENLKINPRISCCVSYTKIKTNHCPLNLVKIIFKHAFK